MRITSMRPRKPERKKKERREWKEGIERKKERKKERRKEKKGRKGFVSWFTNDSNFKNGHNFDFLHLNSFSDFFFIFFFSFYFLFRFLFCFLAVFSSNGLRAQHSHLWSCDNETRRMSPKHLNISLSAKKVFFSLLLISRWRLQWKEKKRKKMKKKKKI